MGNSVGPGATAPQNGVGGSPFHTGTRGSVLGCRGRSFPKDDGEPGGRIVTRTISCNQPGRRSGLLSRPLDRGRPPETQRRYECPSSAVSSSLVSGTEPESRAGRRGKGSTRVSSMTGGAGWGGLGMTAASEWPPQP